MLDVRRDMKHGGSNMLIKSLPENERPQEKALKNGMNALADAELIA